MRRLTAWVAVAFMSAFALYVVAINVFLSTSLFERVFNQDPDSLFVSYERGWSIWPGRVHARRLTIRSSDSNVQFLLRLETCDFTFAIGDLALRKTFHVTQVDGSGITFHARRRVAGPAATPEYVDAIPQIPGFERVPLPSLEPPDLLERWDDAHWHLWTVDLENVVAEHVREVWVDGLRWNGESRVTGGFFLKPIREVRVRDVHVDVHGGNAAGFVMAGTLDVDVDAFDPRLVEPIDIVHRTTMRTDLHGRSADIATLPPRLFGPVKIAGPADVRRLAIHVAQGKLAVDTHVDVALPGATVEVAGHRAQGDLTVVAVVAEDGGPRLAFHVDARALTASRTTDASGLLVRAPHLQIAGDARALDLGDPLSDLHALATLPESEIPDARLLGAYVPPATRPTLSFEGGRARAHGKIEVWMADRRAKAEGALDAGELEVRLAKVRIRGATTVVGSFDAWRWDARRIEGAKANVHVAKGSIAREETPERTVVETRGLEVAIEAADVDADDPLRAFSATLEMPDAEIRDVHLLRRYLPRGDDIRIARANARFDARSAVEVQDYKARGTVELNASRLGFTLADFSLLTDVRAQARVHDWAWERGDLAIDEADVVLTNVAMKRMRTGESALVIPRVALHASSRRFDLSDPLAEVQLSGSVAGGRVNDPIALNVFLPKDADVLFDAEPGKGRFDAELSGSIARHVARGSAAVRGHGVGVRGTKVGIRGNVDATAEVDGWRLGEHELRVKSSRVTFRDVAVRFGEGSPLLAGRVELRASVDRLDAAHPSLHGVDYRLILDEARMDDIRPLGILFGPESLAFAVESGKARASVDVTVKASDKTASGGARILLEDAGVRFHTTHLAGDFEVVGAVNGFDPQFDGVDVSGSTITMRNVRTVGATASASAWNGEATLLKGAVRVSASPAFDGFVQLRADDATPILAMALQNSLPKLIVGMLEAPSLTGQGRITIEPGRTAILDAHLRGGDVVLLGNYVVAGDRVRGAVTVAKGPLSAGVRFDDASTHVRLFRLESWMKDETFATLKVFGEAKGRLTPVAKPR